MDTDKHDGETYAELLDLLAQLDVPDLAFLVQAAREMLAGRLGPLTPEQSRSAAMWNSILGLGPDGNNNGGNHATRR